MTPALPAVLDWTAIHARLQDIFPEGSPNRAQSVWEISARTIFVMLYAGAVEGTGTWIRPDQVTRMTDTQAARIDFKSRKRWLADSLKPGRGEVSGRWYAVNTRESIRDDTLRNSLIPNGAVIEREGLPTTSPAPRYALQAEFASLLDPTLHGDLLREAIEAWQYENLTAGTLARIAILRRGAVVPDENVTVRFPNAETRSMAPGRSSQIAKSVIEDFALRFLGTPAVLWLSESRNKVIARDDELARSIGLQIQADRTLPDIILVDLAPKHPTFVFVEVVASDGPVTLKRKEALTALAAAARFPTQHLVFVTAYLDRTAAEFKKTVSDLAWGSFAWFASEPEHLLEYHDTGSRQLSSLTQLDES